MRSTPPGSVWRLHRCAVHTEGKHRGGMVRWAGDSTHSQVVGTIQSMYMYSVE